MCTDPAPHRTPSVPHGKGSHFRAKPFALHLLAGMPLTRGSRTTPNRPLYLPRSQTPLRTDRRQPSSSASAPCTHPVGGTRPAELVPARRPSSRAPSPRPPRCMCGGAAAPPTLPHLRPQERPKVSGEHTGSAVPSSSPFPGTSQHPTPKPDADAFIGSASVPASLVWQVFSGWF